MIPDDCDMHRVHYWMSTISRVASENGFDVGTDLANVFKQAIAQPAWRNHANRYQVLSMPQLPLSVMQFFTQ
jgi:hypothetical protein